MTSNLQGAPSGPVLTPDRREQFLETGMAHIPGLVPRAAADEAADHLWALLERKHGIRRGRPETWKIEAPTRLQELGRSGAFDGLDGPGLRAVLDELFQERGWAQPKTWGQAFATFRASPSPWNVPSVAWHLDFADPDDLRPWPRSVRVFVLLAPLQPGGGGTVYVAGSHKIVMQLLAEARTADDRRCAPLKEALKRQHPWVMDLCSPGNEAGRIERFMEEGESVRGVHLRVAEITGEAGDVFLMHPAVLHAAARNARPAPRMMVGVTIMERA